VNRFCAAAWEKKMNDTVKLDGNYKHKGAAAAASVSFDWIIFLNKIFVFSFFSLLL
jgi:hypothetical protein